MRLDSLTNYSVAPESKLESDLYPWPSWSLVTRRAKKALDLSPNLSGGVGSNPTGCILVEGPIGATVARQIPVLKVTRSNRVSVTRDHHVSADRYTHRHGFHKVMKAVVGVVDDKIAYFARSCNYTYNLGY